VTVCRNLHLAAGLELVSDCYDLIPTAQMTQSRRSSSIKRRAKMLVGFRQKVLLDPFQMIHK
jgi:hypothetical protein